MSLLDGVVGIKQITTGDADPVPTRGTLHVEGPTAHIRDDADAGETVLTLSSFEGTTASTVNTELTDDVITLDIEGQDLATVIGVAIAESLAIHGMAAPSPSGQGRKTLVLRGSAGRLELKHLSGSGVAGTKFTTPGAASYFLLQNGSIDVVYDSTSSVWRVVA